MSRAGKDLRVWAPDGVSGLDVVGADHASTVMKAPDMRQRRRPHHSEEEESPRKRGGASYKCRVCNGPTRVLATRRSGEEREVGSQIRWPGKLGHIYRRRVCKKKNCKTNKQPTQTETIEMGLHEWTDLQKELKALRASKRSHRKLVTGSVGGAAKRRHKKLVTGSVGASA